jgi:hypothetical protein
MPLSGARRSYGIVVLDLVKWGIQQIMTMRSISKCQLLALSGRRDIVPLSASGPQAIALGGSLMVHHMTNQV